VRRIEALTGEPARRWLLDQSAVARRLADQFKVPVAEVVERVDALEAQRRRLEKDLADAKRQLAMGGGGGGDTSVEDIGGVKFIGRVLQGVGGKELGAIVETYRKQVPDGVVALYGISDGKVANTVAVSPAISARFDARQLAEVGGFRAGGKPDFARGGASDPSLAEAALAAVRELLTLAN
jgi:alanyl-tRNA synthetase